MKTETLPVGGETFFSIGVSVGFGATGDGSFSIAGSLNKIIPQSQPKYSEDKCWRRCYLTEQGTFKDKHK